MNVAVCLAGYWYGLAISPFLITFHNRVFYLISDWFLLNLSLAYLRESPWKFFACFHLPYMPLSGNLLKWSSRSGCNVDRPGTVPHHQYSLTKYRYCDQIPHCSIPKCFISQGVKYSPRTCSYCNHECTKNRGLYRRDLQQPGPTQSLLILENFRRAIQVSDNITWLF